MTSSTDGSGKDAHGAGESAKDATARRPQAGSAPRDCAAAFLDQWDKNQAEIARAGPPAPACR